MTEMSRAVTLESIQIGQPEATDASSVGFTGINKQPVPVAQLTVSGLVDDAVLDVEHHGGPDQAVYVYCRDDYEWWEEQLGRNLPGGSFGENLTLAGLTSSEVLVGDRFEIGTSVVIEATSCRIPCRTFAAKMAEENWVARFRAARRPGFYARVLSEGSVEAGLTVTHVGSDTTIPILETQDLYYEPQASSERLRRALASPIAERTRLLLERRLTGR